MHRKSVNHMCITKTSVSAAWLCQAEQGNTLANAGILIVEVNKLQDPGPSATHNRNGRDSPLGPEPDAIPLQSLGAIETDLSKVSTEEILLHGLANVDGSASHEGGYAVRHSRHAVNEFPPQNPPPNSSSPRCHKNYSVYAFPWLYPYGEGGIESDRDV